MSDRGVRRASVTCLGLLSIVAAGCNADGLTPSPSAQDGGPPVVVDARLAPDLQRLPDLLVPTDLTLDARLAAPVIDSVDPARGPSRGGAVLTISGRNFVAPPAVTIGGTAALDVKLLDANTVQATAPPHAAGLVGLQLENPDGQVATSRFFYFNSDPVSAPFIRSFPAGSLLGPLVTADVNGDQHLDLLAGSLGSGAVRVLLGTGDATFSAGPELAAGVAPRSIAATDLDGDRRVDLAVVDSWGGTVTTFLGDGKGGFVLSHAYPAGRAPWSVAAGDLDGDGHVDLAVAEFVVGGGQIEVFPGGGDGTLGKPTPIAIGSGVHAVAIGDLDGDQIPDVAAASLDPGCCLRTFYAKNDGNAHFAVHELSRSRSVGQGQTWGTAEPSPCGLAIADLDGDGSTDLVATTGSPLPQGGSVLVALGSGKGAFPVTGTAIGSGQGHSVAIFDQDLDGKQDLAITVEGVGPIGDILDELRVYRNDGRGGFPMPTWVVPSGRGPRQLVAADWNGDGVSDMADASWLAGDVVVIPGIQGKGFSDPVAFLTGPETSLVVSADVDGNQVDDLIVGWGWDEQVEIRLADGKGGFRAASVLPLDGAPTRILTGDLNGDGKLDLVVQAGDPHQPAAYLGNGDGTFRAPVAATLRGDPLVLGDFDGDKQLDLLGIGGWMSFCRGRGDGTFDMGKDTGLVLFDYEAQHLVVADLDGDGKLDLLDTADMQGGLFMNLSGPYLGNGDGTFRPGPRLDAGFGLPVSADIDGDGILDVVIAGDQVIVLMGLGAGSFKLMQVYDNPAGGAVPALVDVTGDAVPDLVVGLDWARQLYLFPGKKDFTFGPPLIFGGVAFSRLPLSAPAIGDFDGDGRPDVAVPASAGVDVLFAPGY